jgi:alpha-D-ribose 1-methylphosphonate 5-triphosphate synthase subunit PhnH
MLQDDFSMGFQDPVKDSQAVFRSVLDALANPGTVRGMPAGHAPLGGLGTELASTLVTLTGPETRIALSDGLKTEAVRNFIAFHTGASATDTLTEAAFVFIAEGDDLADLNQCNLGTQDYPDRSTTIVMAVSSLSDGPRRVMRGPGIDTTLNFAVADLPADFVEQWAANRELFPRGVDMLFVCNGQVLGLPRSSRLVEA